MTHFCAPLWTQPWLADQRMFHIPFTHMMSYPPWQSTHHSSHRKGDSTTSNSWRPSWHDQVAVPCSTICLLAWNQFRYQKHNWNMCSMPMSLPTGALKTTSANPSPWCWLFPLQWVWVSHCHKLLLQNTNCLQNSCIPMQCFKDNIYHEVVICRAWNSRIPTQWQWSTIWKCIICWIYYRLEACSWH